MGGHRLVVAIVPGMSIAACSGYAPSSEPGDALHKVAQTASGRVVDYRQSVAESLNLSDYDVFNPRRIAVDDDGIFVDELRKGIILAVAREDYALHRFTGRGTGSGPGEMSGFRGGCTR